MEQVSVNALKTIASSLAEQKAATVEEIIKNSPLPELLSMNKSEWVTWNQMALWFKWYDSSPWAPIDWTQVGELCFRAQNVGIAAAVCRLALSVRAAYWISAKWFGGSQFRVVTTEYTDFGLNNIREVLEIPLSLDPCPQVFSVFTGTLKAMPKLMFNQPAAEVTSLIESHRATYEITFVDKLPLWQRWISASRSIFDIKNIYNELVNQQTALTDQTIELLKERGEFTSLIEGFPDGIIFHHQGKIVFINEKMKNFINRQDSEFIGTPVIDLIVPVYHSVIKERIDRIAKDETIKSKPIEVAFHVFDSDNFFYGECTSMYLHYLGKPCIAVIVRDLSERKKYESHLIETDRLVSLGQLAAGVGHEINNPLCYIILKLEVLKEGITGKCDEEVLKNLSEIETGMARIQTIVGDLKALSRDHAGDVRSAIDITKALISTISMVKSEIQQIAQLEIELSDLQPILINEVRLGQVLLNLLINASHAIVPGNPSKNKITVRAFNEGPNVKVQVADTGMGIPKNISENMFKPFYTTKPVGRGTGLGLPICKSLVSRFNGTLTFETEEGVGTTFTISFPATRLVNQAGSSAVRVETNEAAANVRKVDDNADIQTKKRILIIDDDKMVLETLAGVLSKHYVVIARSNAKTAIGEINSRLHFDAIICDLMMPEMDGMQFYEELKRIAPILCQKIIFLTGGSFTPKTDLFLNAPTIISCQKPVRKNELIEIIEKVINNSSVI